jgi:hypothetical protein
MQPWEAAFADGARLVGLVNAVACLTEAHPAAADRIHWPGCDSSVAMMVGGIGDASLNGECALRTWGGGLANSDAVDLLDLALFDKGQLTILQAYDDNSDRL